MSLLDNRLWNCLSNCCYLETRINALRRFTLPPQNLFWYITINQWTCFNENFSFLGFIARGVGFGIKEDLVWYVLFSIFVPYAMLPLPLRWCMMAGALASVGHIIVISVAFYGNTDNVVSNFNSNVVFKYSSIFWI